MAAYYNEFDPQAAAWLRELIRCGHIAPGDVDERSIEDVKPDDLIGYDQHHFFAGIGVWSYALRLAGWPDNRPVWTASCPCQPFSSAGAGAGFADERHLWPHLFWLIQQRQPPIVIGEQVASKAAEPWIDLVQADMEALGYAFGAVPFPSASVGAPHIRDRLYWVADANGDRLQGRVSGRPDSEREVLNGSTGRDSTTGGMDNSGCGRPPGGHRNEAGPHIEQRILATANNVGRLANSPKRGRREECPNTGGITTRDRAEGVPAGPVPSSTGGRMANPDSERRGEAGESIVSGGQTERTERDGDPVRTGPVNGFWADADWLFCRDGKWRPVEPGTFPLAHGAPARVVRLRGYGNAINAEAARAFIECLI